MGQRSSGGGTVVNVNELLSVGEIRFEPGKGGASDVEGRFEAGKKNGVVYSVKSCCEIQEDENSEMTSISREEDVIGDFKEGCFSAVLRTKARLKRFEQVI